MRREMSSRAVRVLAVIAAVCAVVFVVFAALVWHKATIGLDRTLAGPQYAPSNILGVTWFGSGWAQLEHVAAAGSPAFVTIVVAVVVVAVWALRRDALTAVVCMAGPTLAGVFSVVAKHGVGRLHGSSLSYPSGHETLAAALGAAVVFAAWRLGGWRAGVVAAVVAVPYAALVGTALVRLGWHYPTDVIGGVAVGVGFVCAGAAAALALGTSGPNQNFSFRQPRLTEDSPAG